MSSKTEYFKYSLRREAVWTALDRRTAVTERVGAGRWRNLPAIPCGSWKLGVFRGKVVSL